MSVRAFASQAAARARPWRCRASALCGAGRGLTGARRGRSRAIDLHGDYSALVHGNAFAPVTLAARAALERGSAFGLPTAAEVDLAECLAARIGMGRALALYRIGQRSGNGGRARGARRERSREGGALCELLPRRLGCLGYGGRARGACGGGTRGGDLAIGRWRGVLECPPEARRRARVCAARPDAQPGRSAPSGALVCAACARAHPRARDGPNRGRGHHFPHGPRRDASAVRDRGRHRDARQADRRGLAGRGTRWAGPSGWTCSTRAAPTA